MCNINVQGGLFVKDVVKFITKIRIFDSRSSGIVSLSFNTFFCTCIYLQCVRQWIRQIWKFQCYFRCAGILYRIIINSLGFHLYIYLGRSKKRFFDDGKKDIQRERQLIILVFRKVRIGVQLF